jgi:tRNA A37 threonylcarbamoyladenosine dehydratase
MQPFSYEEAFSRNIGWLTRHEQEQLRRKRVAIAGLGGVGGVHLLTLCGWV